MGLYQVLERFFAGHATASVLLEHVQLAEARSAATEVKLRVLETRCAVLEAEKHFLQVQLIQAQPRRTEPLDEDAQRHA